MLTFFTLQAQLRNGLIGQRTQSVGSLVFSFGPSYCLADPDCSKGIFGTVANQNMFQNLNMSFGYRNTFSDELSYKIALGYDKFTGNDIKTDRNYSFKTSAIQLTWQGEYNYHFGKRYRRRLPNNIYGFLGLGIMSSNANLTRPTPETRTYYGDIRYKQYDVTLVFPYGFGYKYDIDEKFSIGSEFCWRYTFSDFLDGFKTPYPASKSNDMLEGFSLTLSYKLE